MLIAERLTHFCGAYNLTVTSEDKIFDYLAGEQAIRILQINNTCLHFCAQNPSSDHKFLSSARK